MFSPCLCKLLHLQSKNTWQQKQHKKLRDKYVKEKTEIHYFPAGIWEIFIRGRVEGWISCMYVVVFMCFSKLFWFIHVCCLFVMFSPSLFELLHLQTKQHIQTEQIQKNLGDNRTTQTYNRNINTLFPSRNLRYIYSRSGPGLDILYLCVLRVYVFCFSKLLWFIYGYLIVCLCFIYVLLFCV